MQNINHARVTERTTVVLPCERYGGWPTNRAEITQRQGVKNTKRGSSRSPTSGEQLTFVDSHNSIHDKPAAAALAPPAAPSMPPLCGVCPRVFLVVSTARK